MKTNESENASPWENERDARRHGITRGVLITGLISLSLMIGAGVYVYNLFNREQARQHNELKSQEQTFTQMFRERDSVTNQWVLTFNQIEEDLEKIAQRENMISLESSDVEISTDRKQKILDDIQYINSMLDLNKKKIAALNAQLQKSGGSIQGLQEKIADLEGTIKERENEINNLKLALVDKDFEIGQLNERMEDLHMTLVQKDEMIHEQINEMNKGFLAYGTFEDLEAMGLVVKEGGFLGLGRKESLVEDFADSVFREVDVTEVKSIPVDSKKVKLITEHPADSYELVQEDEKRIAYIEIKDPDRFWKISKYAVVEVVK
ncbi:MAG TPA: hypothetical protein ENO20_08840 [Bacteroides sp.]|nr:hypothetical protein [Bacteroides sp.]